MSVQIANRSHRALDLSNAVVTLVAGPDNEVGSPVSTSPSKPLPPTLKPGRTARGVYVFRVGKAQQAGHIAVHVSYSPRAPAAVFSGRASR